MRRVFGGTLEEAVETLEEVDGLLDILVVELRLPEGVNAVMRARVEARLRVKHTRSQRARHAAKRPKQLYLDNEQVSSCGLLHVDWLDSIQSFEV